MASKAAVIRKLAHQVSRQTKVSLPAQGTTNQAVYWTAQFVAIDSSADLAEISINGYNYRNVPRAINAWSSTPSAGTNLRVLQIGGQFEIQYVILGQPELATTQGAGG